MEAHNFRLVLNDRRLSQRVPVDSFSLSHTVAHLVWTFLHEVQEQPRLRLPRRSGNRGQKRRQLLGYSGVP